jgi:hypothetical protein
VAAPIRQANRSWGLSAQIVSRTEAAVRFDVRTAAVLAAASALAVAVPAAAHPSLKGGGHSAASHKCKPHNVAYVVRGTLGASQGPITVTSGTVASGTLQVIITRTNRWAKGDRPADPTQPVGYVLGPKTKVKFDGGTTDFTSGERVTLIGKAQLVKNKLCTSAGTVGTPTIRMVVVHPRHVTVRLRGRRDSCLPLRWFRTATSSPASLCCAGHQRSSILPELG